jgi:hypothetical protein
MSINQNTNAKIILKNTYKKVVIFFFKKIKNRMGGQRIARPILCQNKKDDASSISINDVLSVNSKIQPRKNEVFFYPKYLENIIETLLNQFMTSKNTKKKKNHLKI